MRKRNLMVSKSANALKKSNSFSFNSFYERKKVLHFSHYLALHSFTYGIINESKNYQKCYAAKEDSNLDLIVFVNRNYFKLIEN